MTCDHLIGYGSDCDGGPLLGSDREKVGQLCLSSIQRWIERGLGASHAVAHAKTLDTPEKALAETYDLFVYCPRCGEKI